MGGNHEAKSIQHLVVASKIMPGLVVQGVLDFAGPCVHGVLDPIGLLRVSARGKHLAGPWAHDLLDRQKR